MKKCTKMQDARAGPAEPLKKLMFCDVLLAVVILAEGLFIYSRCYENEIDKNLFFCSLHVDLNLKFILLFHRYFLYHWFSKQTRLVLFSKNVRASG